MFGRDKKSEDSPDSVQQPSAEDSPTVNPAEAKKNRPTPKRSQAQAANRQPLVSGDRKEANKKAKAQMREEKERARIGVMNGEEKYLTHRDRGVQRKFTRDFVDARYSIGELFIPIALVVLVVGMFGGRDIQIIANIIVYGLLALVVLDSILLNYQLKGRMAVKFGGKDKIEKGITFYAVMRGIQMRPLRVPKPQVKRREYPN